jgi:transcriptional regulator with XRE-family HTH domain
VAELAKKTEISEKTIRRVESGRHGNDETIFTLADGLGMSHSILANPASGNLINTSQEPTAKVTMKLEVSFTDVNPELVQSILTGLGSLMRSVPGSIELATPVVDLGSILLTVELPIDSVFKLASLFLNGSLGPLGIKGVLIPDEPMDRERRLRSLMKMGEGMTGLPPLKDLLLKESAIRLAYKLLLLGICKSEDALQTAEEMLKLDRNIQPLFFNLPATSEQQDTRSSGFTVTLTRELKPEELIQFMKRLLDEEQNSTLSPVKQQKLSNE